MYEVECVEEGEERDISVVEDTEVETEMMGRTQHIRTIADDLDAGYKLKVQEPFVIQPILSSLLLRDLYLVISFLIVYYNMNNIIIGLQHD